MSVLLREDYYTLEEVCDFISSNLIPPKKFNSITYSTLIGGLCGLYTSKVSVADILTLTNSTVLDTIFKNYIVPTYKNNSCLKVETAAIYSDPKTLNELLRTEQNPEGLNLLMRLKAFDKNAQELVDKLAKYNTLIANYGTGKKRETKTQMDNNDTPQDYSATPYSTGGYTNNIQVNKGEEQETPSNFDELEALKYIDDISFKIANLFRDLVLID